MKRTSKLKAAILLFLFIGSLSYATVQLIVPVQCDQGSAKVCILQLNDVGSWWVDNTSRVKDGAVDACTPIGKFERIPRTHPLYGNTPPFYDIDWKILGTWSSYVNAILNEVGVIIVNAHGEILPIPNGYTKEVWVDNIAEAMWKRRVSWVNMAGYPFHWIWHQGDTQKTSWGPQGFQRLMSHVGLSNTTIPTNLPTQSTFLTDAAIQTLSTKSWEFGNAMKVDSTRPLKMCDFTNCTIMPLYRCEIDGEIYWEGAVISFAKPGVRVDSETTKGFGSFVHLGTNQTYTVTAPGGPTDKDYNRGYVATAAAIWYETSHFETKNAFVSNNQPNNAKETSLGVAPCITGHWWEQNILKIRLVFGVYGATRATINPFNYHGILQVLFQIYGLTEGCEAIAQTHISKHGTPNGSKLLMTFSSGINPNDYRNFGLAISATSLLLPIFMPAAAPFMPIVGGVMLFSDWIVALGSTPPPPGTEIYLPYGPLVTTNSTPENRIEEFQSLIIIDLSIPTTNVLDWKQISLDFRMQLRTTTGYDAVVSSGLSIAAWCDAGTTNTVFFEDFEDGDMSGWETGDLNSACGNDYWGRSTYFRPHQAWCAQFGSNSLHNDVPNIEVQPYPVYDNGMNAYLQRSIDLRSFKNASLSFKTEIHIKSGDYLVVEYYADSQWHEIEKYDNPSVFWDWSSFPLSINATKLRFRFFSNNDNQVDWGVSIDNIEIKGLLHNDALKCIDAGNTQANAIYIGISSTSKNWAGYLNGFDDFHDWYSFNITSSNINDQKEIYVWLKYSVGIEFDIALYDKNGNKKAESFYCFTYRLQPTDAPGTWAIEIFHKRLFGPYDFDIQLRTYTGGGGCPTLFVWNGSVYNDFGVIAIHDPSGEDVIRQIPIPSNSVGIHNYKAYFRLREGWEGLNYSHSTIDQVKLYAVINGYSYLCPLIYANHSVLGNVLLKLLFSDNYKADVYLLETIDLKFFVPYQKIDQYIFIIEGCNEEKVY